MRLIDADRLLTNRIKSAYYHLPNGDIAIPIIDIEHAPTIEAVPLDKLCEWLAVNASYIFGGCKNTWKFEARHWKDVLTKWMEEQDAADRCRTF